MFAIGFHSHFNMIDGSDASITNLTLTLVHCSAAEGFKKEAFAKDDKGLSHQSSSSVVTTTRRLNIYRLMLKLKKIKYIFGQTVLTNQLWYSTRFPYWCKIEKNYMSIKVVFFATVVMSNGDEPRNHLKNYLRRLTPQQLLQQNLYSPLMELIIYKMVSLSEYLLIMVTYRKSRPHKVYFAITNEVIQVLVQIKLELRFQMQN